jgi:hypothetical protein
MAVGSVLVGLFAGAVAWLILYVVSGVNLWVSFAVWTAGLAVSVRTC